MARSRPKKKVKKKKTTARKKTKRTRTKTKTRELGMSQAHGEPYGTSPKIIRDGIIPGEIKPSADLPRPASHVDSGSDADKQMELPIDETGKLDHQGEVTNDQNATFNEEFDPR